MSDSFELEVEQITYGPKHHFFGYIGQSQTVPWNQSGRYIVALRNDFQDHMPGPGEAADVILIDTENGYSIQMVDQSQGWNPQQGTMFYWNPELPETQFFLMIGIQRRRRFSRFCSIFPGGKGSASIAMKILRLAIAAWRKMAAIFWD